MIVTIDILCICRKRGFEFSAECSSRPVLHSTAITDTMDPSLWTSRSFPASRWPNLIFESLPNEMIACIITDYIYNPAIQAQTQIHHLMRTCRAFWTLLISLPSLWSTLHSDMRVDELAAHLLRSGEAGLKIKIQMLNIYSERRWNFKRRIKPYSSRWTDEKIEIRGADVVRHVIVSLALELANVIVPRLSRLDMSIPCACRWTPST